LLFKPELWEMCFMDDLSNEIADLRRQLAALEERVAAPPAREEQATRRDAFKKLAIGAAGALTAGGVMSALSAEPAAAANGDAITVGNAFTGTTRTTLNYNGGDAHPGVLFAIEGTSQPVAIPIFGFNGSAFPAASNGWVYGATATTQVRTGVYGYTEKADGYGVAASADNGTGLLVRGDRAAMSFFRLGVPAPERTVAYAVGEVIADSAGALWYCTVAGTPGTWRKLVGPGTAGTLSLLPEPLRAYDSRGGAKLAANSTTTINLANGKNGTGATVAAVPAGASAVLANITLTGTVGGFGYIQAYSAALAAPPATSVMNWSSANDSVANEMTIVVDSTPAIKVTVGVDSTHVIVDVVGYYR
jgi:hypothetical protein